MKYCLLIIFATTPFFNGNAQELEWRRFSSAIGVAYIIPQNDFGKYWENAFGLSGSLEYQISNEFSLTGDLIFSQHSPKDSTLPIIYLISLPVGIKYMHHLNKTMSINLKLGLQSNTFEFTGNVSESIEENSNESEFGLYGSFGVQLNFIQRFPIEFYMNAQSIFSSPESITIYQMGMKIFIF